MVKINSNKLTGEEFISEHLSKEYYDVDLMLSEMAELKKSNIGSYGNNTRTYYDFTQYLPTVFESREVSCCEIRENQNKVSLYFNARESSNSDVQEMLRNKRKGFINKTQILYYEICDELKDLKNN